MLNKAHNYLTNHGIRPSVQRAAVMEYLMTHRTHPTVERIYADLVRQYPSLSLTTVYNTLSVLAEKGAALALDLDSDCTHYDGDTSPHAHFICTCCGAIFDLEPDDDLRAMYAATPPRGVSFTSVQLTYKGLCEKCNKTNSESD
jgi:Fe2+ or Zn2+ uptake regulation protein